MLRGLDFNWLNDELRVRNTLMGTDNLEADYRFFTRNSNRILLVVISDGLESDSVLLESGSDAISSFLLIG